jgi:hypothetical protein
MARVEGTLWYLHRGGGTKWLKSGDTLLAHRCGIDALRPLTMDEIQAT